MPRRRQLKKVLRKLHRKPSRAIRRVPRPMGTLRSPVYRYKYTTLIKNYFQLEMNGVDANFAIPFKLSDIPNYLELTALYDRYKISAVKVSIVPRQTQMIYQTAAGVNNGGTIQPNTDFGGTHLFGTSNFGHPEIVTVIDYDDDANPTGTNELLQYNSVRITRGNRNHHRYLKPRFKVDVSNTGVLMRQQWIDCDNIVKHYGLKGQFTNVPNISPYGTSDHPVINYDVILTYYVAFRDTR